MNVFDQSSSKSGNPVPVGKNDPQSIDSAEAKPKKRGRPSKRAAKKEELINGATALFNARGISATSIAVIADVLDLARATIYYYVNNRSELVFQCYSRTCDVAAEDLATASEAESGLDRVLEYVRLSLAPDRAPVAVLSEIDSLEPDKAKIIHAANDRNIKSLKHFIEQGFDDGSIRHCNSEIVVHAIVGMLAWSQLLPNWSNEQHGAELRRRTSDAMINLLDQGISTDRSFNFRCHFSVDMFQPKLDNIFDRKESSSFKITQLLATASRLFNRNGIEATSLDEIAAVMGLTKGAVYHYLEDKNDLVSSCYERSFELYDKFIELSEQSGDNGLEAGMINAHLNIQAQTGDLAPLMPQPGFEALPKDVLDRLHRRANEQNKTVARLLDRGVEQGHMKPYETRLLTHICGGAFGWIPKWLPTDTAIQPMQMADSMCDLILFGLNAGKSPA
ncbi:transcriptional regulator, TetR family [Parasphingorhabdus marina DSM 22363]|uniref:Transcriptional regulator, TetR family n=1 Tax=Parasphingorhabdus marina DSM 22363 TaxID=1123272 RepID=A0A1N6D1I1_9SPHN|nr:TetR family transcriptional regulator [Parasphingorhabdus marina]SIN64648.1 transcriptional regulator, TetR family [Parasphingorhabdus marina DSM 22363]